MEIERERLVLNNLGQIIRKRLIVGECVCVCVDCGGRAWKWALFVNYSD